MAVPGGSSSLMAITIRDSGSSRHRLEVLVAEMAGHDRDRDGKGSGRLGEAGDQRTRAFRAGGVGPGDEVVTTPLTFPATANVIEHCGATPVFADVKLHDGNIEPSGGPYLASRRRTMPTV